jgi:hypothetical protein
MPETTCLVCGKNFDPATDPKGGFKWMHDGSWFTFDDIACRNKFIGTPKKYLEPQNA